MQSRVTAVVGANWGDEGKGKLVDLLARQYDFVVRYQGGSNAGHTINNEHGRFSLHLLPSGVFYSHVTNVLGMGVAFNPFGFLSELQDFLSRGMTMPSILISDRAQMLLPYHILLDKYEEERLAGESFGSTQSGIGPFYGEKYRKKGIQLADLFDDDRLIQGLRLALAAPNCLFQHLYEKPVVDADELFQKLVGVRDELRPLVGDVSYTLNSAIREGKRILLEGQLGTLRDPDHGIYPFSTSSSTLAGFASVGAGIPPHVINRVIAVTKAYSSKVGRGPFVTELSVEDGSEELRKLGGDKGEYGATTGRPRDVGWFDAVATRYGCELQGATEVALTNLDVLGYLEKIPVCVAYEVDGVRIDRFPPSTVLGRAKPVYEYLPGWDLAKADHAKAKNFDDLPQNARMYVKRIEELIDTPITLVSVGPGRDEVLKRSL